MGMSMTLLKRIWPICIGVVLFAAASDARNLNKKELAALDRVNARLLKELPALGLYLGPKDKGSIWRQRHVYGGRGWQLEVAFPAYSFKEMKRSDVADPSKLWSYGDPISGRVSWGLWQSDGTHVMKLNRALLELTTSSGSSLRRRKSAAKRAQETKNREWTLKSNRIEGGKWVKENKPRQSRRAVAKEKTYDGLPGEMFVQYRDGQQRFCTGYLKRWRDFVHELGGSKHADSIEAAVFKDLDTEIRIDVQVKTFNTGGGSCLFKQIKYLDEGVVDKVMQTVARILNEEFKDIVAGKQTDRVAGTGDADQEKVEEKEKDEEKIEESPDDGYWSWFSRYVKEKEHGQQRIDEIRFELSARAREASDYRERWMDLLRLDMELFQAGDVLDDKVAGRQTGASTKRERNRLRGEINRARKSQDTLMTEGFLQIELLEKSVKGQQGRSGDRRKELPAELQRLADQKQILQLQFYDAAEWYAPHQLPKLIRTMNFKGSAPDVVKIIEAKAHLADGRHLEGQLNTPSAVVRNVRLDEPLIKGAVTARFKALQNVREVLAANPDHEEARAMLQQMELYWLNQIGAKLEREKQVSLAAFGAYLENRGYDSKDRSGWWEGFKEYASVAWSSGPISLGAGLPGVDMPWVVAEDVSITQTEIAKNLVSLLVMKRLRKNGVPVAQIREITPDALARQMVLHTASQTPLPDDKARRMVRDIRESFAELGELHALAEGKLVAFNLAMGRSTYGSVDSEQSWGEYLGDAFSPRHLISLFGPSAIVKVGGKWALAGRMAGSEIRAAEAAGQVMRGRDALVAGLRLEKLGRSLASTRRGAWLRQKLIADHQWFTQLPGWEQFLRKGSAVVGTMIILGGASHLAAESGIPGAVLLVDILSELTGQEILFDILSRSGSPTRKLFGRLDDVLEFATKKQDDLARFGRTLDELEDIAVKVRANKGKVTKQTRSRLNGICQASRYDPHRQWRKGLPAVLGSEVDLARAVHAGRFHGGSALLLLASSSASLIPGCPAVGVLGNAIPGTAEEAAGKAMKDVIQALRRGDVAEAQRALKAANDLKAVSEGQLQKLTAKVNKAKQALARIKERQAEIVTEPLSVIKQTQAKHFADPDFYAGPAGRHVLQGDELLRQGEFDEALKSYRAAKQHGDAERFKLGSKFTKEQGEYLDFVEERIALMLNTQKTLKAIERARNSGASVRATRHFAPEEIKFAVNEFKAGRGKKIAGSLNPVREVTDSKGNQFIVKRVADEGEATTEVAAALIADKLGLKAPRAHAVKVGTGSSAEYLVVSRSIKEGADGVALKLSDATEPVAVALKEDYARQRVFRAWLGDSDGHLGNQLFAADGKLWQIDFGMSNLKSNKGLRQVGESLKFKTERDFLEAVVGVPHGRTAMPAVAPEEQAMLDYLGPRFFAGIEEGEKALPYQWMVRMDEMVHYKDMKKTVDSIVELTGPKAKQLKELLKQSGHPKPDKAFDVLKERADSLKAVLEKRFGTPIQTTGFFPFHGLVPLRALEPSIDWMRMAA